MQVILLKKFVAQFCFICFLSKKGTKEKKPGGRLLLSTILGSARIGIKVYMTRNFLLAHFEELSE